MIRQQNEAVAEAKRYLISKPQSAQMTLDLSKRLQRDREFGYAWRILAKARAERDPALDEQTRLKLAQQEAVSTYKDPDLPVDERLDSALKILEKDCDLSTTNNQETLGIAGAIFKRRWEATSQKQLLERSLAYYLKGFYSGSAGDTGYTAINAAYVLDQLAFQEITEATKAGTTSDIAKDRRRHAREIREHLVEVFPRMVEANPSIESQYWFIATVAEAYFGLGDYTSAEQWLLKAATIADVPSWQKDATARQLASLALMATGASTAMGSLESSPAWQALAVFLDNNIAAVRTAFLGKVGLGLSGGGFRASLYHIGILARLAELDMLRHVEVLSCVSGGSIIGAHYYLEVRNLLQNKTDAEISRQDYIDIVRRIEADFLDGVQRNIRTRVAASLWTNLKMIVRRNYSRTERVGELYESELFSRVKDNESDKPRWIDEIIVEPKGEPPGFKPKYDNWRRNAKVPILVLNATALNTGHNWQFTASWMGEPPARNDNEVDHNYRLRRLYYSQAPEKFKKIRLGHAVAASSCVPGLFEPLVLEGLYEKPGGDDKRERIIVRLVDGGVHDNQGIAALLDQDCSVVLISDASGQMNTQDDPSPSLLGVPLRSNSILMSRVREAQFLDLAARKRAALLRGLMFVHLRKDLPVALIDWINCDEPSDIPAATSQLTDYQIRKDVQQLLSAIRTDLDSFSETEAYALMASGYRMCEHEFPKCVFGFQKPDDEKARWRFLDVEGPMKQEKAEGDGYTDLIKLLDAAHGTAFKIWKLSPALKATGFLLALIMVAGLAWAFWNYSDWRPLSVGLVGAVIAAIVLAAILGKTFVRAIHLREVVARVVLGLLMTVFGTLASGLHLLVFDQMFLRRGRVPRKTSGKSLEQDKQRLAAPGRT